MAKSKQDPTEGMTGEDYNYGGAGGKSDAKSPAVVSGEPASKDATAPNRKPAKGSTDDPDWGKRKEGETVPGGLAEVEETGEK